MRFRVIVYKNNNILYNKISVFNSKNHAEGFAQNIKNQLNGTSYEIRQL